MTWILYIILIKLLIVLWAYLFIYLFIYLFLVQSLPMSVPRGKSVKWITYAMNVGPCHHGMARPRVADGGTASNMEGSCE